MDTKAQENSFKFNGIELFWLGHSGFKLKSQEGVIYIDPFQLKGQPEKADVVFISHSHPDHLDEDSLKKILKAETTIICAEECKAHISTMVQSIEIMGVLPNHEVIFGHLKILPTPAYNINKSFHSKEKLWVGFLIEIQKLHIFFAGDTDAIDELKEIECDVALLPVSGIYVMDPLEAASLSNAIKPKKVSIPIHWGLLVDEQNRLIGTQEDAEKFCAHAKTPTLILKPQRA